jgi:hypothetical protein
MIHGNRCLAAIQKTPFWDFMDGMKLPPRGQFTGARGGGDQRLFEKKKFFLKTKNINQTLLK